MQPTDETLNAEYTQKTAAKKKKPGVGPVSIMPPVMPDWSAGVGQAAEAPPPDAVAPQVDQLIRRRRMGDLQNRIMLTQSGASPEVMDRAAGLREMRFQRDALAGRDAPVQKVQTPSEVVGARASLSGQLGALSDQTQKAAMDEIGANPDLERSDPARYAQLRSEIERAARMRAVADTKLAPYGQGPAALENPEVTGIIGRQRALAARQNVRKEAYSQIDRPYAEDAAATREQGFKMRDTARRVERAAGDTALAQTEQAGAEARIAGDPEIIKQRLAAERARATMEARMAGAQGSAGARDAAYSASGLGSAEAVAEFNNKAQRAISANDDEAFALAVVPQLEQIAALDPQEAERLARSLLLVSQQSRPGIGSAVGDAVSQMWRGPGGADMRKTSFIKRAHIDSQLRKFLISQ